MGISPHFLLFRKNFILPISAVGEYPFARAVAVVNIPARNSADAPLKVRTAVRGNYFARGGVKGGVSVLIHMYSPWRSVATLFDVTIIPQKREKVKRKNGDFLDGTRLNP